MDRFSTTEVAKQLGITAMSLVRYIKAKKIPPPEIVSTGKVSLHLWTKADIERVRKLLPKIANGRKTRYKKKKQEKKQTKPTKK